MGSIRELFQAIGRQFTTQFVEAWNFFWNQWLSKYYGSLNLCILFKTSAMDWPGGKRNLKRQRAFDITGFDIPLIYVFCLKHQLWIDQAENVISKGRELLIFGLWYSFWDYVFWGKNGVLSSLTECLRLLRLEKHLRELFLWNDIWNWSEVSMIFFTFKNFFTIILSISFATFFILENNHNTTKSK